MALIQNSGDGTQGRAFLSRAIGVLASVAVVSGLAILARSSQAGSYDEGFVATNAMRVLSGEVPYRDFWAIYPPGQFYVVAALFNLLGPSLAVARAYDTACRFLIVVCVWFLARRAGTGSSAFLASATAAVLLASAGFYTYAVFPTLALGLASMVSVLSFVDCRRQNRLVLAGLLLGSAAFFRWDIALYVGLTEAMLVTTALTVGRPIGESRPTASIGTLAAAIAPWLASTLGVVVTSYGSLALMTGMEALWAQVFAFPVVNLREARWRPYPSFLAIAPVGGGGLESLPSAFGPLIGWFLFYFPILVQSASLLGLSYMAVRERRLVCPRHLARLAVAVLGLLVFAQALSRYDYLHVIPASLLAALSVASLASDKSLSRTGVSAGRVVRVFLTMCLAVFYVAVPLLPIIGAFQLYPAAECHSDLTRAGCIPVNEDQARTAKHLSGLTSPDERIFVGNQRHDRIFVNDMLVYFLAGRRPATFYGELYPGVATTLEVQRQIAAEIDAAMVQCIVLVELASPGEPNTSSVSSGVTYLDEYLKARFEPVARFGDYQILTRTLR